LRTCPPSRGRIGERSRLDDDERGDKERRLFDPGLSDRLFLPGDLFLSGDLVLPDGLFLSCDLVLPGEGDLVGEEGLYGLVWPGLCGDTGRLSSRTTGPGFCSPS